MSYESILIRCDSCNVRIALNSSHILGTQPKPKRNRTVQDGEANDRLYEGACPKCGEPFEIWHAVSKQITHITDLQYDRPEVFIGKARERVDGLTREREELERARAERERLRDIQREEEAERKRRDEEDRQLEREKAMAARRAVDNGDWDDEDYDVDSGGPSQADMDNHADQMNPNNDAYWSSRG